MKKIYSLLCAALVAVAANAQTTKTVVEFEDTQARMLNVESNAIFKPVVVEIEMMPIGKVIDSVQFNRIKMESFKGDVSSLRSWATFQITQKHNADVLVAATYDVTYNSETQKGQVKVVGFPAKFKNWHTVTTEDLEWIKTTSLSREKTEYEKIAPVFK